MKLLEVNSLSKSFGGLTAVQDISLNVDVNQIVSLIGPNGAGKTTVFNLLTGIYSADHGTISLSGENITTLKPYEYIYKGIARTFQNIRLFSKRTVLENILIGLQAQISYSILASVLCTPAMKKEEKRALECALEVLTDVGLQEYKNEMCMNLPYGMQRRLEIARAMVTKPKLILLDEPAAGLNPLETQELSKFIKSLSNKGFSVLLIEHDMRLVMNISDYIYVINYGVKLAEGIPADIQKNPEVIKAYIGNKGMN